MTNPKYSFDNVNVGSISDSAGFVTLELEAEGDSFEELLSSAYVWRINREGDVRGGFKLVGHRGAIYGKCLDVIKQHILETDTNLEMSREKSQALNATG